MTRRAHFVFSDALVMSSRPDYITVGSLEPRAYWVPLLPPDAWRFVNRAVTHRPRPASFSRSWVAVPLPTQPGVVAAGWESSPELDLYNIGNVVQTTIDGFEGYIETTSPSWPSESLVPTAIEYLRIAENCMTVDALLVCRAKQLVTALCVKVMLDDQA